MENQKGCADLFSPRSGVPSTRSSSGGFTAIELIGVLSVIAVLAAAIMPNVIRKIDRAMSERETSDLAVMANGLVQTIKRDKIIPATNSVATAMAKYLDLSLSQVKTNSRGFARAILVDPNFSTPIAGNNLRSSSYQESNTDSTNVPSNTRVLVMSTIAQPAVSTISDSFATIWNTSLNTSPPTWTGKLDDLRIQRLDLGSLFHKLFLLNIDTNNAGYFTLEANAVSSVAPNGGAITLYVLDGTALSLYAGGNNSSNLQTRMILVDDQSFSYQNGRWGTDLSQGDLNESLGDFGTWVAKFLAASPPPYPDNHASPQAVVDQFYTYLWAYWVWGGANFEGIGDGTTTVQDPLFRSVGDAQSELNLLSNNLIH